MAEIGGYAEPRSESPYVHVLEHACPGCGTLLAVDVVVTDGVAAAGDAPLAGAVAV
jgi:hypothetical protein